MPTARRSAAKRLPALGLKTRPAQPRSTATYELILEIAARTLGEVGIERFNTNLVCERAGLTPPALYRYFPNKYALLGELAQRLMESQNALIPRWITPAVLNGPIGELEHALQELVLQTYQVTADMAGGIWVMRALRAVAALQRVRLESHAQVTQGIAQLLAEALPQLDPAELRLVGRVAVDMLYATVELLFDEPQQPRPVVRIACSMVASHVERIRQPGPGHQHDG